MTSVFSASAPRLRLVLSITLSLLVIICGAVTAFGIGYLRNYSEEVSSVVMESASSSDKIDQIEQQIAEYESISDSVDLAEQVVAKRESYQYQDNAYRDLIAIADRAGVNIEQYSFESESEAAAGSLPINESAPSGEQSSDAAGGNGAVSSNSPLKPVGITISLTNPVNYKRFLNFLYYVEQNLTKMQIKSITLSSTQSEAGSDSYVNTGPITVEVYTK